MRKFTAARQDEIWRRVSSPGALIRKASLAVPVKSLERAYTLRFVSVGAAQSSYGFGGFVMPAQLPRNPEMAPFAFLPRSELGQDWL